MRGGIPTVIDTSSLETIAARKHSQVHAPQDLLAAAAVRTRAMTTITFVTGNAKKLEEVTAILQKGILTFHNW